MLQSTKPEHSNCSYESYKGKVLKMAGPIQHFAVSTQRIEIQFFSPFEVLDL